jgi:hypothetical protein
MIFQLEHLIEALREELKQHGEMLALLDQEQDLITQRKTVGSPPYLAAVNTQAVTLQIVREVREQRRRHLARTLCLSEDTTLLQLISLLPADYQPLVQALVLENKELALRVQQRARQNRRASPNKTCATTTRD